MLYGDEDDEEDEEDWFCPVLYGVDEDDEDEEDVLEEDEDDEEDVFCVVLPANPFLFPVQYLDATIVKLAVIVPLA